MELNDLYREVILDHNQNPRHYGRLQHPTATVGLHNPTCGDHLIMDLTVEEGRVQDIAFSGQGCSISMASASILAESVRGKPIEEALATAEGFSAFLTGAAPKPPSGDLEALAGVKKFPARVKCATLAHNALKKGLSEPASVPGGSDTH